VAQYQAGEAAAAEASVLKALEYDPDQETARKLLSENPRLSCPVTWRTHSLVLQWGRLAACGRLSIGLRGVSGSCEKADDNRPQAANPPHTCYPLTDVYDSPQPWVLSRRFSMKVRLTPCFVWLLVASTSSVKPFYGSSSGRQRRHFRRSAAGECHTHNLGTAERRSMQTAARAIISSSTLCLASTRSRLRRSGSAASPAIPSLSSAKYCAYRRSACRSRRNQLIEVTAETSPPADGETLPWARSLNPERCSSRHLNGRNIYGLVALVPGVVPCGQSGTTPTGTNPFAWGNYQIGGGQSNQSARVLDGAS